MPSVSTAQRREGASGLLLVGFVLLSLGGHFIGLWWLDGRALELKPAQKPIVVEIVNIPPPPPPPEEPPPPKEEPKPPPPKPPPMKTAEKVKPPPEEPPPPNEPPPEPEPAKPLVIAGISGASTSTSGSFAAPVGNTAYGKTDKTATDPNAVKAYAAPKYAAPGTTDTDPALEGECKGDYPEEARAADMEGTVTMRLDIDEKGQVSNVRVQGGPGYGLNEAAVRAIRRCRFKPATKDGVAVATQITYSYKFFLE